MLSATLPRAHASVAAGACVRLAARCFAGTELERGECAGDGDVTAGSVLMCAAGVEPAAPVLPAEVG